jgi:ATP-dependent Clp protease ATP-binding subunit ClpA
MFERFTDRARRVLVLAQHEAITRADTVTGTEHLLLALLVEGDGVAARVLEPIGISYEAAKAVLDTRSRPRPPARSGNPPFTPRAKKALELSLREALALGDHSIDTEHLLLGILRQGDSDATQILVGLHADVSDVRHRVEAILEGHVGLGWEAAGAPIQAEFRRLRAAGQLVRVAEIVGRQPSDYEIAFRVLAQWLAMCHKSADDLKSEDVVVESVGALDRAGLRVSVTRQFLEGR